MHCVPSNVSKGANCVCLVCARVCNVHILSGPLPICPPTPLTGPTLGGSAHLVTGALVALALVHQKRRYIAAQADKKNTEIWVPPISLYLLLQKEHKRIS